MRPEQIQEFADVVGAEESGALSVHQGRPFDLDNTVGDGVLRLNELLQGECDGGGHGLERVDKHALSQGIRIRIGREGAPDVCSR